MVTVKLENITAQLKKHDIIICIGSDERLSLLEGMLDKTPVTISLGPTPITEDKYVDPKILKRIFRVIKNAR